MVKGMILFGSHQVGEFNFIQAEDYSKYKIIEASINTEHVDIVKNRSHKLQFMIVMKNDDGNFKLIKDMGSGIVEGGLFINERISHFRNVRFVAYNKNSELN